MANGTAQFVQSVASTFGATLKEYLKAKIAVKQAQTANEQAQAEGLFKQRNQELQELMIQSRESQAQRKLEQDAEQFEITQQGLKDRQQNQLKQQLDIKQLDLDEKQETRAFKTEERLGKQEFEASESEKKQLAEVETREDVQGHEIDLLDRKNSAKVTTPLPAGFDSFDDALDQAFVKEVNDKIIARNRVEVASRLQAGDMQGAKDIMLRIGRSQAGSGAAGLVVTRRQELIEAMNRIDTQLDAFYANGGKTGPGAAIKERIVGLGGRTSDEVFASITGEIQGALQRFRQALSGAAFSVQEAEEYKKQFPDIGSVRNVNDLRVNSLRNIAKANQGNFYKSTLGQQFYEEQLKSDFPIEAQPLFDSSKPTVPVTPETLGETVGVISIPLAIPANATEPLGPEVPSSAVNNQAIIRQRFDEIITEQGFPLPLSDTDKAQALTQFRNELQRRNISPEQIDSLLGGF